MPGKQVTAPHSAADVPRILAILHKWGIHTVGAFAALDKEDLSLRLGPAAVRLWERANGKSVRLLKLIEPPEIFQESFEFDHEIETSEPLLFILRRFLSQLAGRLDAIYLVARQLTLSLTFDNREIYRREFKIPQPTNDVDLLFRVLHTHLENFKSDHPIIAVALEAEPTKPASQQFGLFETALRNPAQLSETLARLVALLGNDRVGTPVLEETHRPDAFRMEPFQWQTNQHALILTFSPREKGFPRLGGESVPLSRWERRTRSASEGNENVGERQFGPALRRFRPNIPASVFLEHDRPVHFRSAKISGRVAEESGPYRASGNWWDEQKWSRLEWDLETNTGMLLRCHHNGSSWQIDGIYD